MKKNYTEEEITHIKWELKRTHRKIGEAIKQISTTPFKDKDERLTKIFVTEKTAAMEAIEKLYKDLYGRDIEV